MSTLLVDVSGLNVQFGATHAVRDFSLVLAEGESVGLVGESGSGKSAALLALMGLHPASRVQVTAERLRTGGTDLLSATDAQLRDMRGGVAGLIFQDPLSALNPLLTVGAQVSEVLRRHRGLSAREARQEATALLALVGITDAQARLAHYPHEFSGGMRQRVMIATVLAGQPRLLLADEPTTALDVSVQSEIVRLILRLRAESGMGLLWVTHDLALMAGIVDRVVVMYAGRVMETAPVDALYAQPRHPYTRTLLASLPRLDRPHRPRAAMPAEAGVPGTGCPFAPRCPQRFSACDTLPPLFDDGTSQAACWLLEG
ncbi:ABC transporter ATP-binding protein [Lichenicola cladoniae]|uniref:ABC transporter ATP-binding protein n=1 Tax=Lichenicola cladoniae TaxID=1484109 RepID=A0A6M8HLJ1_9PROT|nr:ABC transporter ATP-binding protein [Lichenicola cladoniae]QKE89233.1 ABC transporter ATP-binding protein [Lichenicola cladoniae]